ncbi:VanZ family protein [Saccharopolyspora sp.]|uniref:VanZ family protein n=1 Tax=Saccharopolyspora sp. TaxID=33915 RepID=UPI0025E13767|nr:VanZ family protein [Saccharopolyspora sp.]
MSERLLPALIGIVTGIALAVVLFVPYVARQYRRRGQLGAGHLALALAAVVYGVSLVAYVLLPFPQLTPDFCATEGAGGPQWIPFNFLNDMRKEATGTGVLSVLSNPALTQIALNVGLFVPLGMFVRYLFGRSVLITTAVGFGVSLLIEATQGTGIWFLYPCAYRLFDVDDLIMNTAGALAGAWAAPALRAVPGQRLTTPPGQPRPITWSRRLLASVCDLAIIKLSSTLCATAGIVVLMAVNGQLFGGNMPPTREIPGAGLVEVLGSWLPWLLLVIVLPLAGGASSVGQRIVQLRAVTADGAKPRPSVSLVRSLAGVGGYLLLIGMGGESPFGFLGQLFGLVSLICLFSTAGQRGLSYKITGLSLVDAREQQPEAAAPAASEQR